MSDYEIPSPFKDLKIINPDEKIIFCKKCVISNQRPRVHFNEDGICGQCVYSEFKKENINWDKREKELEILCDKHRSNDGSWDIVVPGSGGKDSGYVAHTLKKKYGMHPLTITWAPALPTDNGLQNLTSFINSGFDNITIRPNGKIHRKLTQVTFEEFGDNFMPFIYGQYNYPFHIAINYKIPLIMFGENGDLEYGGSLKNYDKPMLDPTTHDYITEKMSNKNPEYWENFNFTKDELKIYLPPKLEDIKMHKVEEHYFSYYENWKPEKNYEIAKKFLGFKPNFKRSEGTYTSHASLDDKTDGFHYYLGFMKYGIGRATSDAAHQIRDGIISRDEGINLIKKYDGEFPNLYLEEFLEYMELDMTKLNQILDKFRRPIIWKKESNEWKLRVQIEY